MDIFAGKQKAWIALLVAFGASLVMQVSGAGEGPSADQISGLAGMTGEIITAGLVGLLTSVSVYLKANV